MLRCRLTALTLLNARFILQYYYKNKKQKKGSQPKTDLMDQNLSSESIISIFQIISRLNMFSKGIMYTHLTLHCPLSRPEIFVKVNNL